MRKAYPTNMPAAVPASELPGAAGGGISQAERRSPPTSAATDADAALPGGAAGVGILPLERFTLDRKSGTSTMFEIN